MKSRESRIGNRESEERIAIRSPKPCFRTDSLFPIPYSR